MADRNYLRNPNSPFFSVEDDDVDDDTFLRNSRQAQKLREIEDRALRSAQQSVSILRETEEIGVKTAEELMIQREKLERTEKNLDDINTTLRYSQKHINGIKSVFGGLKNYFSGRGDQKPGQSDPSTSSTNSSSSIASPSGYSASASRKLTEALESKPESQGIHPGLRIRGLSDEDDDVPNLRSPTSSNPLQSRFNQVNEILDKNIDEVGSSLARLKGLAQGLGEEIESQNDLIDRIHDKTDRAEVTVGRQNREIKRLLK
ncbi:Synaptosomal-associated protein 29 [Frankliniella fusca]|uniref:Synaptosomal-associated protein 29 n=1 Tax=Frankliniella fusca TaxID=407009 RepID=A0AAE1HH40_9NEOP|nr:Synaptosomal-associated protein 29 [Frankliniella fusca]